jgi:hypothetical protein
VALLERFGGHAEDGRGALVKVGEDAVAVEEELPHRQPRKKEGQSLFSGGRR